MDENEKQIVRVCLLKLKKRKVELKKANAKIQELTEVNQELAKKIIELEEELAESYKQPTSGIQISPGVNTASGHQSLDLYCTTISNAYTNAYVTTNTAGYGLFGDRY